MQTFGLTRTSWRRRAVLLASSLTLLIALPLQAEIDEATLWEKTLRAQLVVRVTVLDGDNRLAQMQVDEVIKGAYGGERLRVVFRAQNMERGDWEGKISFAAGEKLILFLKPFVKEGVVQAPDQFSLVRGYQGREEVPPEGTDAYLQAVRRFVEIHSLESQLAVWDAARGLLSEENPHLVEAGFQQILKFRLGDEELAPEVLELMDDPNVTFRMLAAQSLGQILEDSRRLERPLMGEDHLRDQLLYTAMNDKSEEVRVEAIRALEANADADLLPTLDRIADEDPSQAVRYQAERTIYEIRGTVSPRR